eukprot:6858061-Alexandrium_andersonii.AAC.1
MRLARKSSMSLSFCGSASALLAGAVNAFTSSLRSSFKIRPQPKAGRQTHDNASTRFANMG